MGITREEVAKAYNDMMNEVKEADQQAEMEIIYKLYKGMSESMQKAVKDIMLATQEEKK